MSIAFLGLGNMGCPMAGTLLEAGHQVTGYDPVDEAAAAAKAIGVRMAESALAAVADAEVIITMLPSGTHVRECYQEILPALRPGSLLIDSSTIEVADARSAAEAAHEAGHQVIDAPVSGGVVGAQAGTLAFMVGGTDEAYAAAGPYLNVMGARVVHCGAAGAGQAAKICNNLILGVSMIAVSEAFSLGERLGLSAQALFDVSSAATGQCWALTTNCPVPGPVPTSPANRDYTGGFASGLMLKDLRLAAAAAEDNGASIALGAHAEQLYAQFVQQDGPRHDFSAIITAIRDGSLDKDATS